MRLGAEFHESLPAFKHFDARSYSKCPVGLGFGQTDDPRRRSLLKPRRVSKSSVQVSDQGRVCQPSNSANPAFRRTITSGLNLPTSRATRCSTLCPNEEDSKSRGIPFASFSSMYCRCSTGAIRLRRFKPDVIVRRKSRFAELERWHTLPWT